MRRTSIVNYAANEAEARTGVGTVAASVCRPLTVGADVAISRRSPSSSTSHSALTAAQVRGQHALRKEERDHLRQAPPCASMVL